MRGKVKQIGLVLALFTGMVFSTMLIDPSSSNANVARAASNDCSPDDPNIVYIGRWDRSDSNCAISHWPGAYFKTNFNGSHVKLKMDSSANIYVSIDGGPDIYYAEAKGIIDLTPVPLTSGVHTLRVAARSEWDNIHFQGLILDEGATTQPPAVAPKLIEFIGDSITAGLTTSKAALTDYGWLSGEKLGVEHTQIAFSGVCLTDNCNGKEESPGMQTQFFKRETFTSTVATDWDFSQYQPAEVVINLGTNDGEATPPDVFENNYILFLQNIRQKYPEATIFVLSTFLGVQVKSTQNAVAAVKAGGDTNIYYIDTTGWIRYGSDYNDGAHPSDSGQATVAQHLIPILQSHLQDPPVTVPDPKPDPALPAQWYQQDVGSASAVGLAGSGSYSNHSFTISGSGDDIGNSNNTNGDAFHYVYRHLHGDGSIVARVVSLQDTDAAGRAGVMIRETLALGSMFALTALTSDQGSRFERRVGIAGSTTNLAKITTGPDVKAPYWVKLTRQGDIFTSFVADDGINWVQLDSDTIPMASDVFIGLAVTAHDNTQLGTAIFEEVDVH